MHSGQVFDASKYELETVVRFTKELLIIHDINHNSRFLGEIYAHWGVVTNHHHRGVQERGLVYVAYAPLEATGVVRGINPMLYYLEDSPLTVSEVHHEKVRYEDPNGLTVEHEHLSRITLLEVMEAADEGTKAITQEAARLLLNPVPRPA